MCKAERKGRFWNARSCTNPAASLKRSFEPRNSSTETLQFAERGGRRGGQKKQYSKTRSNPTAFSQHPFFLHFIYAPFWHWFVGEQQLDGTSMRVHPQRNGTLRSSYNVEINFQHFDVWTIFEASFENHRFLAFFLVRKEKKKKKKQNKTKRKLNPTSTPR